MTDKSQYSVYLPGLNAMRFFAAFLVIVTHIELLKGQLGFSNSFGCVFLFCVEWIFNHLFINS